MWDNLLHINWFICILQYKTNGKTATQGFVWIVLQITGQLIGAFVFGNAEVATVLNMFLGTFVFLVFFMHILYKSPKFYGIGIDILYIIVLPSILTLILGIPTHSVDISTDIASYFNLILIALLWQTIMTLFIYFEPKFFRLTSRSSSIPIQQTLSVTEELQEPGILGKI